jgi:hypothetical protein
MASTLNWLKPLDFYLDHLKLLVYSSAVNDVETPKFNCGRFSDDMQHARWQWDIGLRWTCRTFTAKSCEELSVIETPWKLWSYAFLNIMLIWIVFLICIWGTRFLKLCYVFFETPFISCFLWPILQSKGKWTLVFGPNKLTGSFLRNCILLIL